MEFKDEEQLMINTKLMKMTGLYQLLNPRNSIAYGFNIFKGTAIIYMIILILTSIVLILNTYYFSNDVNEVIKYLMYLVSSVMASIKLYYLMKHSDTIWRCIHLTSIDSLSYECHRKQILEVGRSRSKLLTSIFTSLWLIVTACCVCSPFVSQNYYVSLEVRNEIKNYRYNVLNLVFPVTDKFYNDNFMYYYYTEMLPTIFWGHSTLIFNLLIISMCFTFSYQLKTINNSFSKLDIAATTQSKSKFTFDFYNFYEFDIIIYIIVELSRLWKDNGEK